MMIPTEFIGSIPSPLELIEAIASACDFAHLTLDPLYERGTPQMPQFFDVCRARIVQQDTWVAEIRGRAEGTWLAEKILGNE